MRDEEKLVGLKVGIVDMKILQLISRSSDNIIGSGRIELEDQEESQRIVVGLRQLEKVVEIVKDLKWNNIVIRVQNDYPLFLSDMGDEKQEVIGIFICPIVDNFE